MSHHAHLALIVVILAGSIFLGLAPIVNRNCRYDPWASIALFGVGLSGFVWVGLAFFILHVDPHSRSYQLADAFKSMMAGTAVGLLLLLFISGQFFKVERRRKRYLRLKRFLSGKR